LCHIDLFPSIELHLARFYIIIFWWISMSVADQQWAPEK
jgi:hypothetical protein